MHTEKRATSEDPRQQPLGAVVWGFSLFLFLLGGKLVYEFPATIEIIKRQIHSGGFDAVRHLFFILLAHLLALWLVVAALQCMRGCCRARVHVKYALLCTLYFFAVVASFMVISDPTDILYIVALTIHALIVGASLCFLKKWNVLGTVITIFGFILSLTIAHSPKDAFFLLYEFSAEVPILAFFMLFYFTQSVYMTRLFSR